MKRLNFKKIDAFAAGQSTGNPAGAIYLDHDDELSPAEMQRIAAELKGFVNEVGYASRLDPDTFRLKYYSSEREVDFCGHATIAMMYDLIKNNADLLQKSALHIVTNKGKSLVQNRIPDEDAVFISAPAPIFSDQTIPSVQVADALQIDAKEMNAEWPVEIVNAGLETLIVPIRTLQTTLSIHLDFSALKLFCEKNAIDIVLVFSAEVSHPSNRFRTRVFAPRFGYLEDPATGSGNAAFGHYLFKHGKWNGEVMSLEQNDRPDHPNIIKLMTRRNDTHQPEVAFGGRAVLRIQGEYFLA